MYWKGKMNKFAITVGINILLILPAFCTEDFSTPIDGVRLGTKSSSVCSSIELQPPFGFHLCFFVKIYKTEYGSKNKGVIFDLKAANETIIKLAYDQSILTLSTYKYVRQYRSFIVLSKWIRFCIEVYDILNYNASLKINYLAPELIDERKTNSSDKNENIRGVWNRFYLSEDLPSRSSAVNATLCIGDFEGENSFVGEIVGLTIDQMASENNYSTQYDKCIGNIQVNNTYNFDKAWDKRGNVGIIKETILYLCYNTHNITLIERKLNYYELKNECKLMGGRMLYPDEIIAFNSENYVDNFGSVWAFQEVENSENTSSKCPELEFDVLRQSECTTSKGENYCTIPASDSSSRIHGVRLKKNEFHTCSLVELQSMEAFYFCFFVRIEPPIGSIPQFFILCQMHDRNSSLQLGYDRYADIFTMVFNGKLTRYKKFLKLFRWNRICIEREINVPDKVILEINHSTPNNIKDINKGPYTPKKRKPNGFSSIGYRSNVMNLTEFHNKVILCIGSSSNSGTNVVEVAGITVEENRTKRFSNQHNKCIGSFQVDQTITFNETWTNLEDDQKTLFLETDLCSDTYGIKFIAKELDYWDHQRECRNIGGRMLYADEVFDFINKIETLLKKKRLKKEYNWVVDGKPYLESESSKCPSVWMYIIDLKRFSKTFGCSRVHKFNLCIFPSSLDFMMYGHREKFFSNYALEVIDGNLFLDGEDVAKINMQFGGWKLNSSRHNHYWILHNETEPFGRKYWKYNGEDKPVLLTLTSCRPNEFMCNDATCLSIETRCNEIIDCSDESDEENCELIEIGEKYKKTNMPLPRKGQKLFELAFFPEIKGMNEIKAEDGIAKIDLNIRFTWYDPRLRFWNQFKIETIQPNNIWTPEISIMEYKSGMKIDIKDPHTSCQIMYDDFKDSRKKRKDFEDPYMGSYIDGNDQEISCNFSEIIKIPCKFNFRTYPFGIQTCVIKIWPENILGTYNYNMYYANNLNNNVNYFGTNDLGEYYYSKAVVINESSLYGVIEITLTSLYGFHVLNSFIPSFLMSLISYASLFFPVDDFNERIMVSITSLLVLAALFTQSSESSVQTSYLKYLDIWYVSLIIYCFLVIMFNTYINKIIEHKQMKQNVIKSSKNCQIESNDKEENPKNLKNIKMQNLVGRIIFASSLVLFITFYSLCAYELI